MDPNICPPKTDYEKDKEIDNLEGEVSYDLSSQSSSSKSIVNFDFDLELPSHESYIDKGKSPIESVYVPDVENKCSINTSIPSSSQQKEQTTGLNKTNAHSKTNNHSVNNSSSSVKSNSYFNSSNSNSYSTSRTHKSTLYHNDFVAHSGNFKKFKMVWKKKSTTDDSIGNMSHTSPVVDARSFVSKTNLPYFVRTTNQLISLSATNLCCSTCGTNDFVDRRFIHKWYGTYSIPTSAFITSKANLRGPNKAWVPKYF